MNMCRFAGRDDGGYNRFLYGLDFCVDQSAGVLTENNMRQGSSGNQHLSGVSGHRRSN
jgi:hypothetical protein